MNTNLMGTVWRHRKKGGIYRVTQLAPERADVYLTAETKDCRSTWKAECLLPYDYEKLPEDDGREDWRLLKPTEPIERGDEWWDERDSTWNPTTADSWGCQTEGMKVRRKVTTEVKKP